MRGHSRWPLSLALRNTVLGAVQPTLLDRARLRRLRHRLPQLRLGFAACATAVIDARVDTRAAEHATEAAGFAVGHGQLALSGLCPDCAAC